MPVCDKFSTSRTWKLLLRKLPGCKGVDILWTQPHILHKKWATCKILYGACCFVWGMHTGVWLCQSLPTSRWITDYCSAIWTNAYYVAIYLSPLWLGYTIIPRDYMCNVCCTFNVLKSIVLWGRDRAVLYLVYWTKHQVAWFEPMVRVSVFYSSWRHFTLTRKAKSLSTYNPRQNSWDTKQALPLPPITVSIIR